LKRGEELCALIRRYILNHHLIVRRQRPSACEQHIHWQFEALLARRLGVRVRHLRDKCRRTPFNDRHLGWPALSPGWSRLRTALGIGADLGGYVARRAVVTRSYTLILGILRRLFRPKAFSCECFRENYAHAMPLADQAIADDIDEMLGSQRSSPSASID